MRIPPLTANSLAWVLAGIFLVGCPGKHKKTAAEEPTRPRIEFDFPEDEDLDDLPEAGETGDEEGELAE